MNFNAIVESFYKVILEVRPEMQCDPFEVAIAKYNLGPNNINASNDSQEMFIEIAMSGAYRLVRDLRMDGLIPGTQRISGSRGRNFVTESGAD